MELRDSIEVARFLCMDPMLSSEVVVAVSPRQPISLKKDTAGAGQSRTTRGAALAPTVVDDEMPPNDRTWLATPPEVPQTGE